MQRSVIETIMGAVVLIVAGLFLYLAHQATGLTNSVSGYALTGRFRAIDGLTLGSDVRIGGVKVGTVTDTSIDPKLYEAVVEMTVHAGVRIPVDSAASIANDGVLGGRYVKLTPGMEPEVLSDGGVITDTHDVVALEDLLGRAIFLITED